MSSLIRPHSHLFEVQRILAALLFGLIFLAYLFAYLLYLFPAQAILWRLSVPLNHLMQPITGPIDNSAFAEPRLLLVTFFLCMLAPLTPVARRSWLATAASGHAALAVGMIVLGGNVHAAVTTTLSASLSPVAALDNIGAGTWSIAMTTLTLVALCALNHIAFFRATRRP
jgi:hypothetical protein